MAAKAASAPVVSPITEPMRVGRPVLLAGLLVEAAHSHGADIIGRLVHILARLAAESREAGIDYLGIYGLAVLIAKPELLHDAGTVALEYYVVLGQDALYKGDALRVLEVYLDGALATVLAAGEGAHTVDVVREAASSFAPGGLYLDDVRAVVGKVSADYRAGGVHSEIENLDALKHFSHVVFLLLNLLYRRIRPWSPTW